MPLTNPHEIHAQEPLPVLQARLPDVPAPAGHAGVVDEQVHRPELPGRAHSELLHVVRLGDVDAHSQRFHSSHAGLCDRLVERVLLHVR